MAYTKTNWVSGETPLSAANMNNIEAGIEDLNASLDKFLLVEHYSQVTSVNDPIAPGDNTYYIDFNTVPKGYAPVYVVGVNTSGNGSSSVRLRGWFMAANGLRAGVKLRSEASTDITGMTIDVAVLYVKLGSV